MIESIDELITIDELCKLLKVKESHIRSLIFKGELQVIKVGRLIRFNRKDLTKWLQKEKFGTDSQDSNY